MYLDEISIPTNLIRENQFYEVDLKQLYPVFHKKMNFAELYQTDKFQFILHEKRGLTQSDLLKIENAIELTTHKFKRNLWLFYTFKNITGSYFIGELDNEYWFTIYPTYGKIFKALIKEGFSAKVLTPMNPKQILTSTFTEFRQIAKKLLAQDEVKR